VTTFASLSRLGDDLLTLLTSVLNPLPGVAVLPLAMLLFGLNETAIRFVIANATIWPIAIALNIGFKSASPTLVAFGRNIGLSRLRLTTDVLVPAALPFALAGLRSAWAFG
jgi:sulfonate transport system permease protein